MTIAADRYFHEEHMWVRPEGNEGVLGISAYAQEKLGEVALVEVPPPGTSIVKGQSFGTVESAKVASELFAPVSGEILETNAKLSDEPWLVNDDPYGKGWIARVRLADPKSLSGLLTAADYEKLTAQHA